MAIYRLSAQSCRGIIIDEDPVKAANIAMGPALSEVVARAMEEFNLALVKCSPGILDITPSYWENSSRSTYVLDVGASGDTAKLHVIPRSAENCVVRFLPGGLEQMSSDTLVVDLPEQTKIQPLCGPINGDPRIRLHELIVSL